MPTYGRVSGNLPAADAAKLAGTPDGYVVTGGYLSAEIDLTAVGITVILLPIARTLVRAPGPAMWISTKNGTVTTAPTFKMGTDASNVNTCASQTPAGLASQALDTIFLPTTVSPVNANLSLAATGFRFEITSGAVLGTATLFRARIVFTSGLLFTT